MQRQANILLAALQQQGYLCISEQYENNLSALLEKHHARDVDVEMIDQLQRLIARFANEHMKIDIPDQEIALIWLSIGCNTELLKNLGPVNTRAMAAFIFAILRPTLFLETMNQEYA